jgi:hypothetical protein
MTPEELESIRIMKEQYNKFKTGIVLSDRLLAIALFCGLMPLTRTFKLWSNATPLFRVFINNHDDEGELYTIHFGLYAPYKMLEYNICWNWLLPVISKLYLSQTAYNIRNKDIRLTDLMSSVLSSDIDKAFAITGDLIIEIITSN